MSYDGDAYRLFPTVADALIAGGVDDQTKHDVLAALMDHIGVPALVVKRYRNDPAIVALFAERGVTLIPERATQ